MSHKIKASKETIEFIDKYLEEDQPVESAGTNVRTIEKRWDELNRDFNLPNVSADRIAYYIRTYFPSYVKKRYDKFLQTLYWVAIADKVKLLAEFMCQLNNSHSAAYLNVHHGGYKWHGRELQHYNLLICLCGDCHDRYHVDQKNDSKPRYIEVPAIINKPKVHKVKAPEPIVKTVTPEFIKPEVIRAERAKRVIPKVEKPVIVAQSDELESMIGSLAELIKRKKSGGGSIFH